MGGYGEVFVDLILVKIDLNRFGYIPTLMSALPALATLSVAFWICTGKYNT